MATITTVTPPTTTRAHVPGTSEGRSLAGAVDLGTTEGWSYVSSFVVVPPMYLTILSLMSESPT